MRRRTLKRRLFWTLVVLGLLAFALLGIVARGAAALRAAAPRPSLRHA